MNTDEIKIGNGFIITTLFIFPLPQVAIDMYLPSLPSMAITLHAGQLIMQLSLTVYIITLGSTQLVYGPLSDRFGRKPILLIGTGIFLIGSIFCLVSQNWGQLLIGRALQGCGMGCGLSVASAILGSIFSGRQLARMTALSSAIYSLSPVLAPVLGGYLQLYFGWRYNFIFISLFAVLLFIAIKVFLFEVKDINKKQSLRPISLAVDYSSMFINPKYTGNILCIISAFGTIIVFNVVGPFLIQNILGYSPAVYGNLLFLVGLSYFIGTLLNNQLLKLAEIHTLIVIGIVLLMIFSLCLIISGSYGWFSATSVILFTSLGILSTGFITPNCLANAMQVFPEKLGAANALMGSLILLGASLVSIIATNISIKSEIPLGWMFFLQAILCGLFYWVSCYRKLQFMLDAKF